MVTQFDWLGSIGGSPVFLILIACSVITLTVALERAVYYWKRRGNPDTTFQQALRELSAGDAKKASWACQNSSHPMGPAAFQILESQGLPLATVEERLQITLSEQKLLLERNLVILGTMAAIAPLIGLLGTVWGIMRAFHDMALTGSAAPSVVAAGVAEALVTTAAGLVVAVPAVLLYNHFSRRMNVMLTVAENHARNLRTVVFNTGTAAVAETAPTQQAA